MKQEVRKYKMSDFKLAELAQKMKNAAVRDLSDLEEYGVSTQTLNSLQSAIFHFSGKANIYYFGKMLG